MKWTVGTVAAGDCGKGFIRKVKLQRDHKSLIRQPGQNRPSAITECDNNKKALRCYEHHKAPAPRKELSDMRATLYQHPSAPVTFDAKPFDPREQDVLGKDPVAIRASIDANNRERAAARKLGAKNLPDLEYPAHVARPTMQGLNTIHRLMDTFGVEQVVEWVENAAKMRGVVIEGV